MTSDTRVAVIGLGYVGPAARDRLRRGGPRRSRASTSRRTRVGDRSPDASPIDDITDERLAAALTSGLAGRDPGRGAARRRRRDLRVRADADQHRRRIPISGRCSPRPGSSATTSARSARRPPIDDLPGHHHGTVPRRSSRRAGSRAGIDFDLAYAPERVNPGDPASARADVPRLVGGIDAGRRRRGRRRCSVTSTTRSSSRLVARRRRDGEAARERLPQRQHRVRQPARAAVRADGPRRLGGHRRGGDQAVRVHALHARARGSAATASRSTRTTCRGGRASSTSSIASSSSPATSTWRCRGTWSTSSPRR